MKSLLINDKDGQVQTAITVGGKLREIYIDSTEKTSMVGHIILGRLDVILPGQFAFIDIGTGKNALVNINSGISLKKGQPVLVQVHKDPTGSKGAYLNLELRHKGRYVVLFQSPRSDIGVSQKISCQKERERLRKLATQMLPKGFGIIMRTNAAGQDSDTILSEIKDLLRLHEHMLSRANHAPVPSVIHPTSLDVPSSLSHLLVDILSDDLSEIWISSPYIDAIKHEILSILPSLGDRIYAFHGPQAQQPSLFDTHNITSQIFAALKKTVQLPSGGFITIEQTEACVVIDVNTGRSTGKKDFRTTVLETNIEAACAIAWQLNLRNLSGIIIVDFIGMPHEQDKSALMDAFAEEIKKDRIKTELVSITELGLAQLTRKRTREPLSRLLQKVCPNCSGAGLVNL